MKICRVAIALVFFLTVSRAFAGTQITNENASVLEAPRFEVALESAYLLGVFGNPNSYEIGAEFLTARVRWGMVQNDSWLRGYNQFYVSAVAEPIFRGPENHYFGFNFGLRYNFVRPGSRFVPYFSGGLGLGWIDSHPSVPGAQGQDFTFKILTAPGLSYKMTEHWKLNAGILYQHLSNGGQTDPNPSLNILRAQVGLNYSFLCDASFQRASSPISQGKKH